MKKLPSGKCNAIAVTEEQTIQVMHVQFDWIREGSSVSKRIFNIFLPRSEKCMILFLILERVNVYRHNIVRAIRPVWCYSFGRRRMRKPFIRVSMCVCVYLHSSVDVLSAHTQTQGHINQHGRKTKAIERRRKNLYNRNERKMRTKKLGVTTLH